MANRTIELTLKANTKGLINGVRTARRAARDAGWELDKFRQQNEQAWNTVGRTVTAAGTRYRKSPRPEQPPRLLFSCVFSSGNTHSRWGHVPDAGYPLSAHP